MLGSMIIPFNLLAVTKLIWHFSVKIIQDLEENITKIHLPHWQFYLLWVIGQWDMASSMICMFPIDEIISNISKWDLLIVKSMCHRLNPVHMPDFPLLFVNSNSFNIPQIIVADNIPIFFCISSTWLSSIFCIHMLQNATQQHISNETWNIFLHMQLKLIVLCIFFSCDQAALRTLLSVHLSVRLSVCPSFDYTFLTIQRSKVKVTEVMTPFSSFRTVTPVWINIWQWNDAQSLMLLRRGALLIFTVILQISRSHC